MPCRVSGVRRLVAPLRWSVLLGLYLAAASSLSAQTVTATTGGINGTVTDSTGAVLAGAGVQLSGASLMGSRSAVTNESGSYRFSALPAGEYILSFERVGFARLVRAEIRVGLGFTATVDAELSPGGVTESVDVSSVATVIDRVSTTVGTHFSSRRLAILPGARDFFAIVSNTPGIAMTRMDVGGNAALSLQDYSAYGLRALTGMNRNEVEGIRVGAANGTNDNYLSDFSSFAEIAINAAGNSAAVPVPGTFSQHVSKSGGNVYHGSIYAGFQNDAIESVNIDGDQIARGVSGGPGLDASDVNRLEQFRDFNADLGGYVKKSKAWWYGAYRATAVEQRYAWLRDGSAKLAAQVGTGKLTYLLSPRQKLVGYLQYQTFTQDNFFTANVSQPIVNSDALPSIDFPVTVWKAEYNAAPIDSLYAEARVGGFRSNATVSSKSAAARIADSGANTVMGGAPTQGRLTTRPQASGSLSYMKGGWWGSHTFRIGGEFMADQVSLPYDGFDSPCNCVSTLNNGVPTQVQFLVGPNVSQNNLSTAAGYIDDTWRVSRGVSLSLGLRLDRYQPSLPLQEGPGGERFVAVDPVLTFKNWGPRAGLAVDVTGNGATILKLHYGKYWLFPGPNFTASLNPNPSGWSRTNRWITDLNRNGQWDPGEEGSLVSVSGGSVSTRLDPEIKNSFVHQATAYIERALGSELGIRTGFVFNARRQPFGTVNSSRPLSAYSTPLSVVDPGPDGRLSTTDDGGILTAYNLAPEVIAVPPVNLTANLPGSDSEYYTWEITATKRPSRRWSMLASFTHTWHREAALGTGNDFTPNALVNTTDGQDRFTTWQAKMSGTVSLPWEMMIVPLMRHQSGVPFARTFVQSLNYGNATLKAEPIAANRTPNITLVDLRTEKAFTVARARVVGFVDVYNVFNANAEQILTTSSGGSWLRPTAITGPRILRLGARAEW